MASTTSPPGQSWYRRLAEGIKYHPFGSVLAVLAFGLGAVLLVTAYFLGQPAFVGYNPFAAYLATNIGGLLIFVTAYSLLSEVLLKREFMQRLSEKLDEKLLQGSLAK